MQTKHIKNLLVFLLAFALLLSAGCGSASLSPDGKAPESDEDILEASPPESNENLTEPETAPEPETESETEPLPTTISVDLDEELPLDLTFETAYGAVMEQYRQALADPDFSPEAYPLVNADAVSRLANRWSRYADDDSALYASYYDIDGNDIPELIVRQTFDNFDYNTGSICGIYTMDGAEAAALPESLGFTADDLVTIYDSGLIRCVKNGFLTAPAQVTDYRLDGEACALQVQTQWTYTCTEDGDRSFETGGGPQTPERFYADCGQSVYLEDRAFLSAPDTAGDAPVVDLEDVPGAEEGIRLPKITLEGKVYEDFNEAIRTELLPEILADENHVVGYFYDWSLNGDVLCVWVFSVYPGGTTDPEKVCRFSVSEARELSEEELLAAFGMTEDEYDAWMLPALYGAFFRWWDGYLYSTQYPMEEDVSYHTAAIKNESDTFEHAKLVLDRDGRLACLVEVRSLAGASWYYEMLPILR